MINRLKQDPDAELFVFVGRWSNQKGVDAIADVFPSIMERHPRVQLICVGPVIDLYGKFAALKLARMMKVYKGRVFSQPEFTALPPYMFSGADFALMPSRDEPFGLVAVEFGRKGVLCVGECISDECYNVPVLEHEVIALRSISSTSFLAFPEVVLTHHCVQALELGDLETCQGGGSQSSQRQPGISFTNSRQP